MCRLNYILLENILICNIIRYLNKKDQITFDGKEGKITFSVKKGSNYRISTDKKDLRTSREQGALVGDNFKIGIEFCDDYKYFFDSSLDSKDMCFIVL